jgi:hypothetical protein
MPTNTQNSGCVAGPHLGDIGRSDFHSFLDGGPMDLKFACGRGSNISAHSCDRVWLLKSRYKHWPTPNWEWGMEGGAGTRLHVVDISKNETKLTKCSPYWLVMWPTVTPETHRFREWEHVFLTAVYNEPPESSIFDREFRRIPNILSTKVLLYNDPK